MVIAFGLVSCDGDASGPAPSLLGTWDLIGFSDAGVQASTTGEAVFRADGTFSIDGTVTFPGEPTDTISVSGTYEQRGDHVDLTIGEETGTWTAEFTDDDVVLTEVEPAPANTISLRRRG
jgi:hypothetical protein